MAKKSVSKVNLLISGALNDQNWLKEAQIWLMAE
jgi:hypothetical protein